MSRLLLITTLLVAGLALTAAGQNRSTASPSTSTAVEDWQKTFDDICSKTQDAMVYSVDELKAFLQKCDALQPKIDKLDDTRKKVYSRRLAQCRGLYAYVLESKQNGKK